MPVYPVSIESQMLYQPAANRPKPAFSPWPAPPERVVHGRRSTGRPTVSSI